MDERWKWGDEERPEHERRWIVSSVDDSCLNGARAELIRQGYFGIPSGMRVRITGTGDDRTAEMMVKTGRGISRTERPAPMNLQSAGLALESTPFRIRKRRYYTSDGFEVNFYRDNLDGLITVEREMTSPDLRLKTPGWAHDPVEVTDTVCDKLLASLSYDFEESPGADALRAMLTRRLPRIVLTGGPCSGKSTAIRQLTLDFPEAFHVIPEVATIAIREVGVAPPFDDRPALRRYNRAFGGIQRWFEMLALYQATRDSKHAVLMDRGTMDNAAYVPGGVAEIESIYMTSAADEYARYDAVIDISVPSADVYRRQMGNNPARYESYDDVLRLARHTIFAWGGHPNHVVVPDFPTWEEKYAAIRQAVMKQLAFP